MDPRVLYAFQDEMRKLAAERKESPEKAKKLQSGKGLESSSPNKREERASLGAMGANIGAYGATLALMKNPMQPGTAEEMKKYVLEMGKKMGAEDLKFVSTPGSLAVEGWAPYSEFSGERVNIPLHTGDAVIAHELGHAVNAAIYNRTKGLLKFMPHAYNASTALSGAVLMPALSAAARDKNPTYKPGVIQAILASPMVAEEAAASARAVSHLVKEHGLGKGVLKSLPLVPAFATYASIASAPLIVTYLRRRAAAQAAAKVPQKEKKSEADSDKHLSFFERHPKKILGAGALAAAGGGYLLMKGKKLPKGLKVPSSPHTPKPRAPKPPTPKPSLEEAKKLGLPGAQPIHPPPAKKEVLPKNEAHLGADAIQAARDAGTRAGMPEHKVRDITSMSQVKKWKDQQPKPGKRVLSEEDADRIIEAAIGKPKHSSIASRLYMAYSQR